MNGNWVRKTGLIFVIDSTNAEQYRVVIQQFMLLSEPRFCYLRRDKATAPTPVETIENK